MNAEAYLKGYLHKTALDANTFMPPTADPSPQTDANVKAVEGMAKEKTLEDATAMSMDESIDKEAKVELDLEIGDVVLTGRYKNKRTVVKELGTDELGMPTMNGQKLLALRVEKLLPKKMWTSKTLAEASK
jgi:hypothetical protein